jgi:hypothetical protein
MGMQTIAIANLEKLSNAPKPGEVVISVDVAAIHSLSEFCTIAASVGFAETKLGYFALRSGIEVHLLLLREQREPGTVLGDEFDARLEALVEATQLDPDAIRFDYGGGRTVAA